MLPKTHRLPKSQFQSVFRTGQKMYSDDLMCVRIKTTQKVSRFAFVVSKKIAKHAVDRNRMKRVLRESVHHLLPEIKSGLDCVIIAQKKFAGEKEQEIKQRLHSLLLKLNLV